MKDSDGYDSIQLFDKRSEHYRKIAEEKRSGKYHYIPFSEPFPMLSKYLPGIIPGIGFLLLANSGIGKSKLFRYMFMQVPYEFCKNHPESGLTFKVIANALEETPEEIADSLVINRLRVKYNYELTINDLNGFAEEPLSDEVLHRVEVERAYFADLGKHLILVNEGNPYGFYKKVREYAESNGKFYDAEGNLSEKGGAKYVPDNPNEIVICATDHIWLYGKEGKMTKYETVANYSSNYCRQQMNNRFGYTTVNIQQLESNKEKKEFTVKGASITEKLEPSLDSIGDIKVSQRDSLVILALFSPYRYRIPEYRGYNTKIFMNTLRFFFLLKNRRGKEGAIIPVFFDGAAETFIELPLPDDPKLQEYYDKAKLLNS